MIKFLFYTAGRGLWLSGTGKSSAISSLPLLAWRHQRRNCSDEFRRAAETFQFAKDGIMAENLAGKKIAILVENGFEQAELLKPREALDHAGATTVVVSPVNGKVKGWDMKEWGDEVEVDMALSDADPADFDALQLPGGVMNPDHLRMNPEAVEFVRAFFDAGKPVAAICHAPWSLIEADVVRGRRMTSWPSLKTDLKNAGAQWVDEEVVRDGNLVTSRKPDDIPAFNREMIALFAEAAGRERRAA
jgi:protease I